jgi:2-amino-4-hydroxy-6-hydroxymethyldihydropteridine diphosphokinase
MDEYPCILGLGSNTEAETKMAFAREALVTLFPDIHFSSVIETQAIGTTIHSPFLNQVACLRTSLSASAIKKQLKDIEKQAGRQSDDKSRGIVKLDIDLIIHGQNVLKRDDLSRDFIKQGIEELRLLDWTSPRLS